MIAPDLPDAPPAAAVVVEDRARGSDEASAPPDRDRPWMGRLSLGAQHAMPSEQQRLLADEGYGSLRWMGIANADFLMSSHFGLGAFGGFAFRNDDPVNGGPDLRETIWMTGIEAPMVLDVDRTRFCFTPRFGYATGTLGLHGGGKAVDGVLFGGELTALLVQQRLRGPRLHFGVGVGAMFAATEPPGAIAGEHDLGGIYLTLAGGFDG